MMLTERRKPQVLEFLNPRVQLALGKLPHNRPGDRQFTSSLECMTADADVEAILSLPYIKQPKSRGCNAVPASRIYFAETRS